jgi:hypothetical protein
MDALRNPCILLYLMNILLFFFFSMARSKVLLGDLPDLIKVIVRYFLHDYKTLYSCVLVNRLWCRLTIPLLWENPFSFPNLNKNYHFIEVYLHNLNDDDKMKLNECGIDSSLIPSNTLFNYPSFIKHFNIDDIINSIRFWRTMGSGYLTLIIYELLLNIFIENGASLRAFMSFMDNNYLKISFELISLNPNFIRNVKNLLLNFNGNFHHLEFLCSNCDSISFLSIHNPFNSYDTKYFSKIVKSQRDLKKIQFDFASYSLRLLQSLKNFNCLNTLNTIAFYHINFKDVVNINFKEIFEQLNVLKSIHILNCYSLNLGFIQNIINTTKSFKLKTLFLYEPLQLDLLQLLLQKFGYYLENVGFNSLNESEQNLVTKYCTKTKILDLNGQSYHAALNMIGLIQNLNHLSITTNEIDLSSILLLNLGQILPNKLDYLHMDLKIIKGYFETFLKNSQNTIIEKLLIRSNKPSGYNDILPYIKEYIMKKKKVKYLAVVGILLKDSLKDKEKEFKLHNIILSNYIELKINHCNFIDEMY